MAAISGQEQRAVQHFQASLQGGAPQSDVRFLSQACVNQQLSQLGLSAPIPQITGIRDAFNPFSARLNLPDIKDELARQRIDFRKTLHPFK